MDVASKVLVEHTIKVFLILGISFLLGIRVFTSFPIEQEQFTPANTYSLIAAFLIGSVAVYVFLNVLKLPIIMKLIELLSLLLMSFITFYFLLFNTTTAILLSIALTLLRVIARERVTELTAFTIAVGGSLFIGTSFSFYTLAFFSLVLIAYDFISVFITKHMVAMAEEVEKTNLAMTITTVKGARAKKGKFAGLMMGLGDIILPSALTISAYALAPNLAYTLLATSIVGYFLMLLWLFRIRKPIPALLPMLIPQLIVSLAYFLLF
ncbi:MAG: hypothetical protein D6769_02930 [Methanobacteriota archaeon]|nr:MAG: hypothetical protein D6769_02930 [Euryarchaeota archaeon]